MVGTCTQINRCLTIIEALRKSGILIVSTLSNNKTSINLLYYLYNVMLLPSCGDCCSFRVGGAPESGTSVDCCTLLTTAGGSDVDCCWVGCCCWTTLLGSNLTISYSKLSKSKSSTGSSDRRITSKNKNVFIRLTTLSDHSSLPSLCFNLNDKTNRFCTIRLH